jgi:RHO1 GDP-GTP exchange protein 1/2
MQVGQDPRIRKHDLATFLNRPVTRLPRLSLLLEHLHKLSDSDHPDHESLPLTLSILSDFLKSTQPGIAAAESRAKFWEVAETLVFVKGEMIVSDCLGFQ